MTPVDDLLERIDELLVEEWTAEEIAEENKRRQEHDDAPLPEVVR